VTGDDVPNDEMPNILRPGRRESLSLSDTALVALLEDTPVEPAPGLQPVADVLAALRAGPTSNELAGEARALAEFRRAAGVPAPPRRSRHRRPHVLSSWAGGRAAAAMGFAALGLAVLAAAAFVGVLPAPVQQLAHQTVDAPPATTSTRPVPQVHHAQRSHLARRKAVRQAASSTVPAPCADYLSAWAHGTAAQRALAQRNLITAAGGAAEVTAYCERPTPLPGWPVPWSAYHTGRRVPPSWRDRRFPHHWDGHGIPPGERYWDRSGSHRSGSQQNTSHQNTSHRNDKPRAHRTGRQGQHHPPPATGRDAQIAPTRHRAVTRSQLGRVGPRHRSEG
jgi:hypothetical protein